MNQWRRIALVTVTAFSVLLAGACSGSDEGSERSGASQKSSVTATANPDPKKDESATSGTLDDSDFSTKIGKIKSAITEAGTDACKLSAAQNTEPPEPATSEQVAQVVDTYTLLLRSMAGVISKGSPVQAAALRTAADSVDEAAKTAKYSQDFLKSDALAKAMTDQNVSEGISAFAKSTKGCSGSADMSGTS